MGVARKALLSLALSLLIGSNVSATHSAIIRAEVCNGVDPDPTITLNPASGGVVHQADVQLQFHTKFVYNLTTKRGSQTLASSTLAFSGDQHFSQNITLDHGDNHLTFIVNGGCPRHVITQNYILTFSQETTLDRLITNNPSPALTGQVDSNAYVIEVTINGQTYSAINNNDGTWSLPAGIIHPVLVDGQYDVQVKTIDGATNSVLTNRNFPKYLIIDTQPPLASLTVTETDQRSPALGGVIDETTSLIEVAINGQTYSAINNGDGTWSLPAGTIHPALASGDYPIQIRFLDLAGNETIIRGTLKVRAANELGFILAPTTGYLRIHNFNLPSWLIYTLLLGILGFLAIKKCFLRANR